MSELSAMTTIVVGASRGLGYGIAMGLAAAGAPVIAVSRTAADYGGSVQPVTADAGDATVPARLLDRYQPDALVLVAGAVPHMRPLQQHTWETFSVNWDSDVRVTFHWLREALLRPLAPGSRVVVFSSGAAANPGGSPLSGGYAGAKATQRFITGYAREEAARAGLGITFTAVLPKLAPATDVGRAAIAAYAARAGQPAAEYEGHLDTRISPETAADAVASLLTGDADDIAPAYLLGGDGLRELA